MGIKKPLYFGWRYPPSIEVCSAPNYNIAKMRFCVKRKAPKGAYK